MGTMMLEGVMEEEIAETIHGLPVVVTPDIPPTTWDLLAGETAQGAFNAETLMAGVEDDSEWAWSAEEYAVDIRPGRRHWPIWAALVVVLCLVTGAAVWLGTVFYQEQWGNPSSTAETPKVVTPVPAPTEVGAPKPLPSPGPPVQHENPPAPTPSVDEQFLTEMRSIPGITITDPQELISSTKVMCTELRNGDSPQELIASTASRNGIPLPSAQTAFDVGTTFYCPEFSRR